MFIDTGGCEIGKHRLCIFYSFSWRNWKHFTHTLFDNIFGLYYIIWSDFL